MFIIQNRIPVRLRPSGARLAAHLFLSRSAFVAGARSLLHLLEVGVDSAVSQGQVLNLVF